ncbi:RHS repeat domain-containing protein [Streptomyces sp. NPDC000345]|uniref:RHS repeat domain-containing protein n=1 Tax=Streptomyces sp. NPDC000345 TaxID=3364537 RepID=UPI003691D3E2
MRPFRSRTLAALVSKGLLAGLLSVVVFAPGAAVALPDGRKPSVPSRALGSPVPQPAEPTLTEAPKVSWPKAGRETVDFGAVPAARRAARPVAGEVSVVSVRETGAGNRPAGGAPAKVDVEVLDRRKAEAAGGVGLALRVARKDGGETAGKVDVSIDYSGFAHAYGGDFAGRLRLVKLPACAATTPELELCRDGEDVAAVNDTEAGTLTATVEAAPQVERLSGMAALSEPAVYAVASGASSDDGDYRASTLSPTGKWDVSLGSGAFTYSVPVEVPEPPMGEAPGLSLNYNSQSIDGRTSASNNQASWTGMGWDLNAGGFIERRYKNCTLDGHATFGDLCWDSPNSSAEPSGAVYVINLDGLSSELVQDKTGDGSYHVEDDPGWRVQRLTHDADDWSKDYWVVSHQDGTRYYFGWGTSQRTGAATHSTLRVPVVGDDTGEPCHGQYPEPCRQTWRWNLDRVVTANEVENAYFYEKDTNHYRSVAAADRARSYDSAGYLTRIEYGWSSQIAGAQLPAKVEFQTLNRCVERMEEKDPLDNPTPDCPAIDAKPASYPDVPVDLICDGPEDGESCAGKTYYPTFFQRKLLWDIKTYVRDDDTADWDLVMQYQMKYALVNPSGSVSGQLWLDYIQRRGYAGTDVTLPTLNFNGEWQDNKVGDGELNFRRVNKVFTDTGSTITATYGHATDGDGAVSRQCDENNPPSQSGNAFECFWQKWTPDGSETERTGWFKKFVVTKVVVDPGDLTEGNPSMTTTYQYDGAPGWRFTADPLVADEDESWSEWRGYGRVLVTTGAGANKHSTYHWLYRGLDGDRTSKTDASQTRSVNVTDSEDVQWKDSAWLAGKTLQTSTRDHDGKSQQRQWHTYWVHTTARYTGLPDARFVRETEVRTLDKVHTSTDSDTSTWREHVTQYEYEEAEAASGTFGLPLRTDEWGATGVSDNHCTEYGRAYNTGTLDSTGAQRWMVFPDDERHYTVSCTTQAEDQANGQDTLHQDRRKVTFYDGATSFAENDARLSDGNATQIRTHTGAAAHRTTRAEYDAAGRTVKAWDGRNNLTTTTYTPATSWPLDGVATTTPDPDGTGGAGPMTTTEYISRYFGQPWKVVDVNGRTSRVVYDAVGRMSQVFKPTEAADYPDGNPSMRFAYSIPTAASATGVPDVATGAAMKVTSETLQSGSSYIKSVGYYDGLGRARETQTPAPSGTGRLVTVTRYDSSGNVAGTSSAFYNSAAAGSGLVNPAVADIPSYTDVVADWAGRTTLSQVQVKGVPQEAGKSVTRYLGADLVTEFPPVGGSTDTYTDVYGQKVRLVEHIGAESLTTRYEYTRSGQLKYIHDSRENTTHYTYNWAGERVTADDPDAGDSTAVYDDNGNLSVTTDGAGRVLTREYDTLNRLKKTLEGSTVVEALAYDSAEGGKGLLASSTTHSGGKAYVSKVNSYDARGRITSKSVTVPDDGSGLNGTYTFGYGYDAADHLTSVAHPAVGGLPAETVTTGYTTQGRVASLTGGLGTYLAGTAYDDHGRVTSRSLGTAGNGTSVTRAYAYDDANGSGWLKNITTSTLTAGVTRKVQDDTLTRDNSGQVTAARENVAGQQECFRYDDLDRLTDAWTTASTTCSATPASDFTGPDPYQVKHTYDRLGNLQSVTDTTSFGSTTKNYTYPGYSADEQTYTPDQPRPHAVAKAGDDSFSYNDAGQMTGRTVKGVSSVLEWNGQNRISRITQDKPTGDEVSTYVYDADGNVLLRTSPTENVLYLDGHEVHRAQGGTPKATRMYAANGTSVALRVADGSANGTLTWLLGDTQSSTSLLISMAGVVTRRRYKPFGEDRSDSSVLPSATDRGFLGKPEDDGTGLSLLGARMYDASLGRFLSSDELADPYDPQGLSAYTYSLNNPVNYMDETGLSSKAVNAIKRAARAIANRAKEAGARAATHRRFVAARDRAGEISSRVPVNVGPYEIVAIFATGGPPKLRISSDSDLVEDLRFEDHFRKFRRIIQKLVRDKGLGATGLAGHYHKKHSRRNDWEKAWEGLTDVTGYLTAGIYGGRPSSLALGSYDLDYEILGLSCYRSTSEWDNGGIKASVEVTVTNKMTVESATRSLSDAGYEKGESNAVMKGLSDAAKSLFPDGQQPIEVEMTWTEDVYVPN